ncbi:MAG: alpha/beta hydrolase [Deltaproteobacteria bacterium]|nr:alpha/beta hydrolase [Myxococcales bacterium]MDP3218222.1 alpha/beta hydrolase [Deltaproteobacteria bacterium]
MSSTPTGRLHTLRRSLGGTLVDGFFRGVSRAGALHPKADPRAHGVERIRDVAYLDDGLPEHRLDVYKPAGPGPHPVLLYLHGGGFRILSKDTHWVMALAFARRGYVVFNASYRLAPANPFPAGLDDACAAWEWVLANAARYGGDASRVVVAGESAGANLATALTTAACYERPEAFAQRVFAAGVVPRAVVASCGLFQVSDTQRYRREHAMPWWIADRLEEVTDAYLAGTTAPSLDLADPLCVFERGERPARPLPPFFLPVGTADPLLRDTRRMASALGALGATAEARYYPGGIHAFHAFVWRAEAQRCWRDTYDFLDRHG